MIDISPLLFPQDSVDHKTPITRGDEGKEEIIFVMKDGTEAHVYLRRKDTETKGN
jgi:hypothetical protein